MVIPTSTQRVTLTPIRKGAAISGEKHSAQSPALDSRFWLLLSPALPVGGYSYSQGLESAVEQGLIRDFNSARDWIESLGQRVLPQLELPLLARLLASVKAGDLAAIRGWNDTLLATRESAELYAQEVAKGAALERLFPVLNVEPVTALDNPGFAAAFAVVCNHWGIAQQTALTGYAWIWFEAAVAAAIKIVPLGHSDGQRLLLRFNAQLADLVQRALLCADDDLGAGTPGLAMLSSAHEVQHARVFRS